MSRKYRRYVDALYVYFITSTVVEWIPLVLSFRHCNLEKEHSRFMLRLLAEMAPTGRGNTEYKVWQDGYHPEAMFTQKFFRQKLDYLHDNPVRKGFVRRPKEWKYSSAYDYVHERQWLIEIDRLALV